MLRCSSCLGPCPFVSPCSASPPVLASQEVLGPKPHPVTDSCFPTLLEHKKTAEEGIERRPSRENEETSCRDRCVSRESLYLDEAFRLFAGLAWFAPGKVGRETPHYQLPGAALGHEWTVQTFSAIGGETRCWCQEDAAGHAVA